jgi:hypothetical protein
VLPELQALADVGGAVGAGGFVWSLDVLDAVRSQEPGNERLAWAALLGEVGPVDARAALERLHVSGRDRDTVCLLVDQARVDYDPAWGDAEVRRFMGQVPSELIDDLLALRRARAATSGEAAADLESGLAQRVQAQRSAGSALALSGLAIGGRDLQATLGIAEGPAIGLILDRLLADVIEDPSLNRRVTLLTRAGLILDDLVHGGPGRPEATGME